MGDTSEVVEYYKSFSVGDETTLVVRGASVKQVVDALGGVPLDDVPEGELDGFDPIWATYRLAAIEGGVLAAEDSGFADPPKSVLVALSRGGGAAAVVRNNALGHCRFGCARDGELLFDDDEYRFIEDLDSVPREIRALLDLAWFDVTRDGFEAHEDDITAVGLAMVEVVTGIRLTPADAALIDSEDAAATAVRPLQYPED